MSAVDPTNPKPRRCSTRLPLALWICAAVAGLIAVAYQFGVNLSGRHVAIETTDVVPNDESTSSATNSQMAEYSRLFNSRNSERAAPDDMAVISPWSGAEATSLKWEDLVRDVRPRRRQSSLEDALLAISQKEAQTARFPGRDEVSRIVVTRVQNVFPGATEPSPIAVITRSTENRSHSEHSPQE